MPRHFHEQFSEMIIVLSGQIEVEIDGRTLTGKPGDVLHYPRAMPQTERSTGRRALETIFIAWKPGDAVEQLRWPRLRHDHRGRLAMIGTWMYETHPFAPCKGVEWMDQLLWSLLRAYADGDEKSDDAVVTRVKRYIQENLATDLSLDKLAAVACSSRFHFARRFKQSAGISPIRFVRNARLEAARTLLLTTDLPHRKVAEQVGFSDQCNLSRIFRRENGVSPSRFRRGGFE